MNLKAAREYYKVHKEQNTSSGLRYVQGEHAFVNWYPLKPTAIEPFANTHNSKLLRHAPQLDRALVVGRQPVKAWQHRGDDNVSINRTLKVRHVIDAQQNKDNGDRNGGLSASKVPLTARTRRQIRQEHRQQHRDICKFQIAWLIEKEVDRHFSFASMEMAKRLYGRNLSPQIRSFKWDILEIATTSSSGEEKAIWNCTRTITQALSLQRWYQARKFLRWDRKPKNQESRSSMLCYICHLREMTKACSTIKTSSILSRTFPS